MAFLTKAPRKGLTRRFELFPTMEEMRSEMDRLFDQFERRFPATPSMRPDVWTPLADVFESGNEIVVKVDLPGMERKDVKVYVTDHTLTIEGERTREKEIEEESFFLGEVWYGKFLRQIELPETAETEKVEAHYENGILEVRIPKGTELSPKQIPVS